ncbi:hypothetical protein KOR42_04510 [Thalassoglobus neptunius]|uniref:Transcription termination factor Rho n=1 Tax=Thalassoglobus neptunius TaxID=1938619 RepID=A0A5C5X4E0_9PLAN|nr:transcription termination factor Rho [Thalassoglobus neptunius]TWT57093.1 hypothetical protein KOR42_04510 [Thalassoglobus neptunius]
MDDDLDFGAGIVDDDQSTEAPAKPKATRKKTKRASAKAADDSAEGSETTTTKRRSTKSKSSKASAEKEDSNDSVSASDDRGEEKVAKETSAKASSDTEASSGDQQSSDQQSSEQSDEKPRRRRRRRRRGGSGGGEGSSSNNNGGSNNSQQNSGGRRKGNSSQGGKGRRNSGNQRSRPAKTTRFEKNAAPPEPVQTSGEIEGILELHPKGYGFLRAGANDYGARESDPFVSSSFVEKHHLREGIKIIGEIGPGTRGQGPRLLEIKSIDGGTTDEYEARQHFDNLTPINPFEQLQLETGPTPITMRVMDLLTPIGKGQRALLVAPPRSGKTMLMHEIANSVSKNHPEVHLIVLLIDERPEEVTEMRRMVNGEVIASSMDEDVESHVRISQLIFERGKRLAESGKDCLILMDSVTRTARAFNKWMSGGRESKIGTGGLDVRALDIPRKMFGTARRFDEGGSLTVVATALIETGSRMDEAIFQEFKGTGNMELVLSRDLADRRIWPAIDISRSGTRREEKILDPEVLEGVTMLRRSLVSMNPVEAMDQLIRTLGKFETNKEFLQRIKAVI